MGLVVSASSSLSVGTVVVIGDTVVVCSLSSLLGSGVVELCILSSGPGGFTGRLGVIGGLGVVGGTSLTFSVFNSIGDIVISSSFGFLSGLAVVGATNEGKK